MSENKRIFIIFAMEDRRFRDFLSGQSKNPRIPFEFIDMSAREPWDREWKTNCRSRIKNTAKADGAPWEMKCAQEEGVPLLGVYCYPDDRPSTLPDVLSGIKVIGWSQEGITKLLNSL